MITAVLRHVFCPFLTAAEQKRAVKIIDRLCQITAPQPKDDDDDGGLANNLSTFRSRRNRDQKLLFFIICGQMPNS